MNEQEAPITRRMREIAEKAVELSGGKLRLEYKDEWYQLLHGELSLGEFGPIAVLEWSMMEFAHMMANLRIVGMNNVWDQVRHDAKGLEEYLSDDKMKKAYGQIFTIPGITEDNSDKE